MPVLVSGLSSLSNGMVLRSSSAAPCPLPAIGTRQTPQFPQVEAAAANTFAIVDNANTQVLHTGSGVYTVEKISGTAAYNASAVSQTGLAGDFILRLKLLIYTNDSFWGLNSDPLTDNADASIDRAVDFNGPTQFRIYESGVAMTGFSISTYVWIWRFGSTLGYGTAPTLAAAQASPARTVTDTNTLYFDSSVFQIGTRVEVSLFLPQDMTASAALAFTPSGAESAAATLAGSSPLLFAQTAQLLGAITAVGTAALAFTPSGAETAKGGLTGTAGLTFAPSGAETAKGTLVGTTAGIFSGVAGENAGGALTGSATLVFAPSAPGTAKAALSGSSALAFGQTGTLSGLASLAGTAAFALTPSGAETAKGTLVSTSALTFSGSAIPSVSLTQVVGSMSVSFSSAGNVLAFAGLTGSAALGLSGSGIIVGIPAWSASPTPGALTLTSPTDPALVSLTITPTPSATPLAVTASPSAGTFLQDNDPAPLEWSA